VLNPYLVNGNGGFDIVIANPPYIKEYTYRQAFDGFRNSPYYQGKMDIWYGFACKMLDFAKPNTGLQCFIAQNNWITSAGASKLRDKILSETEIKLFTDFGNYKVFETAGIQTMVYLIQKKEPINEYQVFYSCLKNDRINKEELVVFLNFQVTDLNSEKFIFKLNPDIFKGKTITFSSNKASELLDIIRIRGDFYLTEKEIAQGIVPNPDVVNNRNIKLIVDSNIRVGDGVFVVPIGFFQSLDTNEKKYIKKIFEPNEVDKYRFVTDFEKEIIYITKSNYKNDAPTLLKHLKKFRNIMDKRRENQNGRLDYFHLHWPRDEKFFKKGEKILSVRKCLTPTFIYTNEPAYVMMSFNIIQTNRLDMKYLTAILNSKLIEFWLRNKGKMQGNNFQIDKEPLLDIPIYKTDNVQPFRHLVDYIIFLKSQTFKNTSDQLIPTFFEQIIDSMVYELYFPELLKKYDYEIIKHLGELPEFTESMSEEEKMEICKTVYDRLNDAAHPVKIHLEKMKKEIPEIRIIEGLEN
jgi:adenine-specific DNA-methyltransferase